MTQDDAALERAEKHVKHLRDFFYHLMVYVLVNALMVVIDVRGGTGDQAILGLDWAFWLIIFWGFGILGHAVYVLFGDHRVDQVRSRLERDQQVHDSRGRAQ